jgi:hypothetical protein
MAQALAVESRPTISVSPAPRKVAPRALLPRVVRALAAGGAALTVLFVVGTETERAVRGDLLYGLKRQTEAVQLMAAGSQIERGQVLLQRAERRLDEIRTLARGRDGGRIPATMADMDRATSRGSALLTFGATQSQQLDPLADLEAFTARQQQELLVIAPALDQEIRVRAEQSVRLLRAIQDSTRETMVSLACRTDCDGVPAAPPPVTATLPSASSPGAPAGDPPAPPPGNSAPDAGTAPVQTDAPPASGSVPAVPVPPVPASSVPAVPALPTGQPGGNVPPVVTAPPSVPDVRDPTGRVSVPSSENGEPAPTLPGVPGIPAVPPLPGTGGSSAPSTVERPALPGAGVPASPAPSVVVTIAPLPAPLPSLEVTVPVPLPTSTVPDVLDRLPDLPGIRDPGRSAAKDAAKEAKKAAKDADKSASTPTESPTATPTLTPTPSPTPLT